MLNSVTSGKLGAFNPTPERCRFAHPFLDVTKRRILCAASAPNFVTFNITILDIFCEDLAYVTTQLQVL